MAVQMHATARLTSVPSYSSPSSLSNTRSLLSLPRFSGLKFNSASSSQTSSAHTSLFGDDSLSSLRRSLRQMPAGRSTAKPGVAHASVVKVAVLGAAGGCIGQPLSLLIKMSPLVSHLHLYDIANVKGVPADLSHCNTPAQVLDFTGPAELGDGLKGMDLVVIPAGVPRKPGMTRDAQELFASVQLLP